MRSLDGKPGVKVILTGWDRVNWGQREGYRHPPFRKAVYPGKIQGPASPGGLCSMSVEHGAIR